LNRSKQRLLSWDPLLLAALSPALGRALAA
jgi:hypothetical protein